jgi:hemerythrin-like domain-containing protein
MMLVKIGQRADHGFDEPLGLLSDCHRRIEQFLSVLIVIANRRRGGALPPEDQRALEGALHYFATAAPRHSADEEDSLFPRLRSSGDACASAALEALDRLEADHHVATTHHGAVDALARRWLSAGALEPGDTAALAAHLAALDRLYRDHIRVEDQELFPAAGRVLSAAALEAVGREMASRRNVAFAPPAGLTE